MKSKTWHGYKDFKTMWRETHKECESKGTIGDVVVVLTILGFGCAFSYIFIFGVLGF